MSLIAVLLAAAAQADPPAVTVSGYLEAFYQLNFNNPDNLVTAYRGFDNRSNSFTLEDAVLDVAAQRGPVLARIALQVGHAPASYYLTEPVIPAQAGTGSSGPELWRFIQQAYIGYKIPAGRGLLAEAGIFLSPIGLENLPKKDQWNWSRSDLFFALPYYHAGVRFTYPFTDRLSGVLYVVNGWNDIVNTNPYPCFASVLSYAIPDSIAVTGLYFGGVERPTGKPEGQPWRHLFDLTATWTPMPWLAFAGEADAGWEPDPLGTTRWHAWALYGRLQGPHGLALAARADVFHDDPAPGTTRLFFPASTVMSQTLTLEAKPESNLLVRLEGRRDQASSPIYFRGQVQTVAGVGIATAKTQSTLTLAAAAWF